MSSPRQPWCWAGEAGHHSFLRGEVAAPITRCRLGVWADGRPRPSLCTACTHRYPRIKNHLPRVQRHAGGKTGFAPRTRAGQPASGGQKAMQTGEPSVGALAKGRGDGGGVGGLWGEQPPEQPCQLRDLSSLGQSTF